MFKDSDWSCIDQLRRQRANITHSYSYRYLQRWKALAKAICRQHSPTYLFRWQKHELSGIFVGKKYRRIVLHLMIAMALPVTPLSVALWDAMVAQCTLQQQYQYVLLVASACFKEYISYNSRFRHSVYWWV